jgi:hypothetical protein
MLHDMTAMYDAAKPQTLLGGSQGGSA